MIKILNGVKYTKEIETYDLLNKHKKHIRNCFAEYGKEIKDELFKVITTGNRTGRVYKYKGISYTASAPGEPPANRSGRLADSFRYTARQIELVVFSELDYSLFLEEGTVRMQPRPFFKKTNENNAYRLENSLNDLRA